MIFAAGSCLPNNRLIAQQAGLGCPRRLGIGPGPDDGWTMMLFRSFAFLSAVLILSVGCALGAGGTVPLPSDYPSLRVEELADATGGTISGDLREAITQRLRQALHDVGFTVVPVSGSPAAAYLNGEILSCPPLSGNAPPPRGAEARCLVTITVTDNVTKHIVTKLAVVTPTAEEAAATAPSVPTDRSIELIARAIAESVAQQLDRVPADEQAPALNQDITAGGAHVIYRGDGVFGVVSTAAEIDGEGEIATIDLKHVTHAHDPSIDRDVPFYTDVTLNDRVPRLVDDAGQEYALITLYHIDPPLTGLPSREPGIDRGIDFRTPADLVKSAYSNYVSPVYTHDRERRQIPSHPIGHFYVKVQIPDYPTVLTGMTTVQRADTELMDLTLGRELGIGGVLLTPEPGRLNSATEALEELTFRQRELRVVDGLYYRQVGGKNVGPEYGLKSGNVVFARFKVPLRNAKDAMAFFVEFLARGEHNIFGSLINRPSKGTGAGCTPFAMSWLEASGVIPFIAESPSMPSLDQAGPESFGASDFWKYLHRAIRIPWSQIGCDGRLGVIRVVPAGYTVYDLLFHNERPEFIEQASAGLAEKIKHDFGLISGTLFQFGALTPLRDLVVNSKRKDPEDRGDYNWANEGEGLAMPFWDNSRFSRWIKQLWSSGPGASNISLVREGRFYGIEVDAMAMARQHEPFFAEAKRIAQERQRLEASGIRPSSCEELFSLGLQ